MNTRRPAWKTAALLAGGLLVLIGIFFAWVQTVASRRWAELQKRVTEAVAEARGRDPRRPVLRGEAVPGSAWTDYDAGLTAAKGVAIKDLRDWIDGAAWGKREKAEAVVVANEKLLDFLRAGARKAEGAYPVTWEKGFNATIPSLMGVQNLSALAAGKARFLAEAGKHKEAAELLLDAAQFGADLGRNAFLIGEMISIASLGQVFDEMKKLPPDPELGKALALLDASFPNHGEALLNEVVGAGASFMDSPDGLGLDLSFLSAWRFGFSARLMLADAWTTHESMMRRGAAAATASWAESLRVGAELEAEMKENKNPIAQIMIPGLMASHRAGRERRAQLRMLRVQHGGAADLDDPFGGKLLTDGSKVWSVGSDGVDGKGVGDWKPAKTGDIVLELPKK